MIAAWRFPRTTRRSLAALGQVTAQRRHEIENERAEAQKEKVG